MKKQVACLIVSTSLSLLLAEALSRHSFHTASHLRLSEKNVFCQYDPELGWFPIPHREGRYEGSRTFHIHQNSMGFRDREHGSITKQRILFLGDSFVYGYNVEASERFTETLQTRLPSWDVYNGGVSGYGTDQEFLLLQRVWPVIHPDVVFLVFCTENDRDDNSLNRRYGGYYKPYYVVQNSRLNLQGVPVPKSINFYFSRYHFFFRSAFLTEIIQTLLRWKRPRIQKVPDPTEAILESMRSFVERRHAKFIMGYTTPSRSLQEFCIRTQMPCIDLSVPSNQRDATAHWTAQGHQSVAEIIMSSTFKLRGAAFDRELE